MSRNLCAQLKALEEGVLFGQDDKGAHWQSQQSRRHNKILRVLVKKVTQKCNQILKRGTEGSITLGRA